MTRNLKTLGIALMAVVVLGAVAASAASAAQDKFRTTAGAEAHLTYEADPDAKTQYFQFSTADPDHFFSCNKITGKATVKDQATEITTTPTYEECTATSLKTNPTEETKVSAFVEFTTCDYNFLANTTTGNPTGGEHANVQIKCTTPGDEIHTKVTALKLKCITIPEQEIKHAVRYNNTETGGIKEITIEWTPHGIKVTTENSVACPTEGGVTKVHENGLYTGKVTLKGYKDAAHTERTSIFKE
jgi:outer membrane lipoprotein-sorting protein